MPYPQTVRKTLGAAVLLLLASVPAEAPGYRFFWAGEAPDAPAAAAAGRWLELAWPPGGSISFEIAESSGWTSPWTREDGTMTDPPFSSLDEALGFVRTGMEEWSSIPTADVRWTDSGLQPDRRNAADRVNMLRLVREDDPEWDLGFSFASILWLWTGERWEIGECDLNLHPRQLAFSDRDVSLSVLTHELGHCIGLSHAGTLPTFSARMIQWGQLTDASALFPEDPVMSYGSGVSLTPDDRIGASLLRPAPGWRNSVGSLSGIVEMDGAPARFVRVTATRIAGESLGEAAAAFAGADGTFAIEGLPPGEYLLAAGSATHPGAHGDLYRAGMTLGAAETFLLTPVAVAAGQTSDAGAIRLRALPEEVEP